MLSWNEELLKTAKTLAFDGKSAAEAARVISAALGLEKEITRGVVIAACRRHGILFNSRNVNAGRIAALVVKPPTTRQPELPKQIKFKGRDVADMPRVALIDLRNSHCRWPIDCPDDEDNLVRYCGHERPGGKAYCGEHFKLAYVPRKREEGR